MKQFIKDMRYFIDRIRIPQLILLTLFVIFAGISLTNMALHGPSWVTTLFGVPCPFLFFIAITMIIA